MVDTDQAGFQVSGWKSLMDKHNLKYEIYDLMGTNDYSTINSLKPKET